MSEDRQLARNPGAVMASTLAHADFQAKIKMALPQGMSVDRFTRAAITAIQNNPEIIEGDKDTLYLSIVQAAQAGLSLDGKEAALVIFNTKVKTGQGDRWLKKVQFMPMIGGIIKNLDKVGVHVESEVVYENDFFEVTLGLEQSIVHKPTKFGTPKGKMIGCYAILSRKQMPGHSPDIWIELMDAAQVEAVRAQSRAPDSLMWKQFASEGWRKTVTRRCAKRVPIQDEKVERTLAADDDEYDMTQDPDTGPEKPPKADPTVVAQQEKKSPPAAAEAAKPETKAKPDKAAATRSKALAAAIAQRDPDEVGETIEPEESENPAPRETKAAKPETKAAYSDPVVDSPTVADDDDDVF